MNDFNAILSKMKNLANAAGKKAEEVAEASKLKLQMVSLNGKISRAYEELGSMVYHAAKKNEPVGEEMDAVMEKIDGLLEELQGLESKVGELKKSQICPNCGAQCPSDAHFCSRCGMILQEESFEDGIDECEPECPCDEDCCCEDCCDGACECEGCEAEEEGCCCEDCACEEPAEEAPAAEPEAAEEPEQEKPVED